MERVQLHHRTIGESGPRVVFVHGLFGQGRNWTQIAKAIAADGFRCTLLDAPDHGRSGWTDGFTYERATGIVADALAELAPGERWTLVGHSMGGKIGMLLALTRPELLDRLCVVDMSPRPSDAASSFDTYVSALQGLDLASLPDRASADARLAVTGVPEPSVRAFFLQNLRREGEGWAWQMNLDVIARDLAQLGAWPAPEATWDGPVLWLAGAKSDYVDEAAVPVMRGYFPRVRLVTVKDAGHWVHSERPQVVIEALRAFLRSPVAD
ncbi:alpha/beta fold hydrolase [Janibacter massiliensis]|uniref:alpha/beta fold hydrolase n=1 Tax=Janibacter massiliensis TaxID=2058291 RepID=UPI000D112092|nr:alpha/beta fold hydrolase [Janibacter massiliensis]